MHVLVFSPGTGLSTLLAVSTAHRRGTPTRGIAGAGVVVYVRQSGTDCRSVDGTPAAIEFSNTHRSSFPWVRPSTPSSCTDTVSLVTAAALPDHALPASSPPALVRGAAVACTVAAFLWLFAEPLAGTARAWWNDAESGHGLLLAPLALWLAWRAGVRPGARGTPVLALAMLGLAVLARYVAALAAEPFLARAAMLLAMAGLVTWLWGARQLATWWLPLALLALSVPLPEIVLGGLALPLQFKASELGAAMLSTRGIPVHLDGNVIRLPGHDLFVTEACSGLRSLTALLSLGVLLGGLLLRQWTSRVAIILLAIPVAVLVNGVRVFLTGFLVAFVDPSLAEGFSHMTEGWLLFLVAFAILGAFTWGAVRLEERRFGPRRGGAAHA